LSAIHSPIAVIIGFGIITAPPIISIIVSMVISTPVGTSVIRVAAIVAAIVSSISIIGVSVTIVSSISTISVVRVSVSEGKTHAPSHSKSHAKAPAETAPAIAIIGVIGIVIVPTVIIIGEPPKIRGVIILIGIGIVVIDYDRCDWLAVLVQGIILLVLVGIKRFTPFGCVSFAQHFSLSLQAVLFIITKVFFCNHGLGVHSCLIQSLGLHHFLGIYSRGPNYSLLLDCIVRIIIDIIIFRRSCVL